MDLFKYVNIALIISILLNLVNSTIWIKNVRLQGLVAIQAGQECLSKLTKIYFHNGDISRPKNIVVTYTYNISQPGSEIQQRYLTWLHHSIAKGDIDGIRLQLISNHRSVGRIRHVESNAIYETDYYVLVTDNYKRLNRLLRQAVSKAASFNPGAKFIILYNNPAESLKTPKKDEFAYNIFSLLYNRFNAANVIFLYAFDVSKYIVYVTNPYRNTESCGSLEPLVLDICENGILHKEKETADWLNMSKVPDTMPDCTFKFCARLTEPYINDECETGLEIDIIKVMQNILKFKINTYCTNASRGEPYGNGSWSGILGMLRNDECDFVVGGFFPDDDVHNDFGVTNTYFQDAYTWYVFIAPLQPPWMGLITIFQPLTWLAFVIIFILSAITWLILGRAMSEKPQHKQFPLCTLNSWAVFLCISANNRPNWSALRIFFVILALFTMNVTTIYTSKLITVFTHPAYENQIDTIDEIIESGLPIGGREEFHDWFENDNPKDEFFFKNYNFSVEFWPLIENLHDIRDRKRVILLNKNFVLSKSIDDIFGLSMNVFMSPIEMICERGFPLLKPFSVLISHMIDAGIIQKLHDDFVYDVTVLENIRNHHKIPELSQTVLTIDHMSGAFTVLFLGIFVSFLILVGEIAIHLYLNRNNKDAKKFHFERKTNKSKHFKSKNMKQFKIYLD